MSNAPSYTSLKSLNSSTSSNKNKKPFVPSKKAVLKDQIVSSKFVDVKQFVPSYMKTEPKPDIYSLMTMTYGKIWHEEHKSYEKSVIAEKLIKKKPLKRPTFPSKNPPPKVKEVVDIAGGGDVLQKSAVKTKYQVLNLKSQKQKAAISNVNRKQYLSTQLSQELISETRNINSSSGCSCLPYYCVCNNNNSRLAPEPATTAILQHQQAAYSSHRHHHHHHHNNNHSSSSSSSDDDLHHHHHHNQDWVSSSSSGLQNYQVLQQLQSEQPSSVQNMSAVVDFGFVTGPQPASAVYCGQPMLQPTSATANDDDMFQLQHTTATTGQDAVGSSAAYHKCSPTTVLDLGSGTIHKSSPGGQCGAGGGGDNGWQHYQSSAAADYHHHQPAAAVHHHHLQPQQQQQPCYPMMMQQNCSGDDVGYHQQQQQQLSVQQQQQQQQLPVQQQLQYTAIKTEDCPDSLDLMYPMAQQDVDYSVGGGMHSDGSSMDFIGSDAGPMSASDVVSSAHVVDYMVLDPAKLLLANNNFYMDSAYCAEANNNNNSGDAAAFNEFQLNAADMHTWSATIDQ